MTDERMDARLRAAGQAWRAAATGAAVEPEPTAIATPTLAHRRRRVGLLASAAVVAAALVGGATYLVSGLSDGRHTAADTAGLHGTVWRLVGYDNRRDANSDATLYIAKDGSLVADDACSVISAHAMDGGDRLHVTKLDVRDRSCTDTVGETTFDRGVAVLTAHPAYSIIGDELTISARGRPTLHLVAAPALVAPTADVPTLQGPTWRLTRIDGQAAPALDLEIDNGRLTASDGCNSVTADAGIDGNRLRVTSWTSTAVGCLGRVGHRAETVDKALQGSPTWLIQGTTLTLEDSATTLTYAWVPKDKNAVDPQRFAGTTWQLASVAGDPVTGAVTLHVDGNGTLTGTDGCSQLHGTVRVAHGAYTTTGVAEEPTRSCDKPARDRASTVDSFLHSGGLWAIRDGKLLIYGGGAQAFSLIYVAHKPDSLAGPTWKFADNSLVLRSDSYRVSPHCSPPWTGRAVIKKQEVTFADQHDAGDPALLCRSSATDELHSILLGTWRWSVQGNTLTLRQGGAALTFER